MTLSNSIYSRYDIDERLTIDAPVAMEGPLQLVSSKMERNGTDSVACTNACTTQSLTTQRSIFSAYWKTGPMLSRSSPSLSPISREVEKRQHLQRRRRRIHNTFAYTYDRDPYQYFGIVEEESKTSTTDDDDSLNSYERVLQKNEIGVTKNRRRSFTCPSLSIAEVGIEGMVLDIPEKTTQSDTVLFVKTSSSLQRLSCLRKSRFSYDTDSNNGSTQSNKGKQRTSVSFESKIVVRLFCPPVEKWAPSGWSNWFGA